MDLLPKCHVVVSATASPNFTLTRELLGEADLTHDIIFIDLAVPRDIEPAIGEMEHVTLYDIDDFQITAVGDYLKDSFDQAEAILLEQQKEFYDWYDGRDLIPRIQEIQEDAATDLELRIHKILGKLPLEEKERETLRKSIELAAGKVVGKMIFGLRDSLEKETFLACVEGLEKLYEE